MLRVDGAYLYELGKNLQPIIRMEIREGPRVDFYFACLNAREALASFLYASVFSESFRNSSNTASSLLQKLLEVSPDIDGEIDWDEIIPLWKISSLKSDFARFEAVLSAELQGSAIYYASGKGGFDTPALTDRGEAIFPGSLAHKVPDAVPDVRAGARCIAFDLPTAAAFHFHRANEAVLRRYFDEVVGFDNRPKSNNMGEYLNIMKTKNAGDAKVLSVLQSIKDLHRNPIMHPEERIETVDEAISLLSAIRASIGYMLDRISDGEPPVIAPLPFDEGSESESSEMALEEGRKRTKRGARRQPVETTA